MSELFDRLSNLSPKRLALLAMELQERLDAEQSAHTSPIAIVGMGCRLPGAADLDAYWRLLAEGVDAIREVPESRWDVDEYYDPDPEAVGKIATRWAGTLDGIDRFEPQMFGISPREAQTMDPQQRLLLEVAWEALEHAGIAPDSVHDTQTGVYIGVCNTDYAQLLMEGDVDDFDMYLSTGNATSVASGRLSYVLGLQGPALTVDTACSSSLVAVHLAVQSLRTGGCRMALAGGANVILSPKTTMTLSRAKMMAADGRCKAFDSRADGFVRGEGCGLVVLKRLADAEADGDRILAVIRGSALNQDGRSNGLTAPNGPSQVSVIRAALADAGISPGDVSYVETHGTGTALGDPIEAQALGAVYCEQRSRIGSEIAQHGERRLLIGSVKTNFGHLESAAGIAGLIKVVLSLQHREIPPMLHLVERNPYIPWDELPIDIPTVLTPWHAAGGRRIAGVSSFGFSGTNAHVLIEEAAPPAAQLDPEDVHRGDHLLKLSARTEDALAEQADRLGSRLAGAPALRIADVARTLGVGRSDLAYRLTVVTADVEAAAAALAAWSSGNEIDAVVAGGPVGQRPPDIAFLFTGHGSQRVGMGRDLYRADAAFTAAIDHCAELLGSLMDRHLIEVLFDDAAGESLLASMAYAQPALFAIEYALAEMWASWGVRPSVVAGHSIGEYVAAVVAGVMSIEDGIRLVAARGRLMASLPADGEMATVFTTEDVVGPIIAAAGGHVSIAAVNGPQSIALSATGGHLHAVLDALRGRGVEVRPLAVPVAAHSAQMDAILDEFEAVAAGVRMRAPQIDVISTMTGALAAGDDLVTPRYWRQHLRRPVRFGDAFRAMYDSGLRTFVEVGPHPTLLNMARHIVGEHECTWLPSLRSGHDDWRQMLMSAGELYTTGVHLDWRAVGGPGGHVVDLPTYPFQRERYWASPTRANSRRRDGAHPLLGRRVQSPTLHDIVYETALGATWPAFLDHHRIYGTALLPSPAYLEMALAAAAAVDGGTSRHEVAGFEIREALILPEVGERIVQVVVHGVAPDRGFEVVSRLPDGDEWTLHATGHLRPLPDATHELFDLDAALARCDERIGGADYYGRLAELGLEFGSGFRGVTDVWRRDGEAVGRVVLPSALLGEAAAFNMHPALLDACFHVLGAPMVATDGGHAYLLVGLDEFRLYRRPGSSLWNHTVLRDGFDDPGAAFSGDIRLYDDDGTLVAEALGLHLRHASSQALLRAARGTGRDWLYEVSWQPDDVRGDAGLRPSELAASLGSSIDAAAAALEGHDRLVDGLDAVAVAAIAPALRELGAPLQPGDAIDVATLAAELGVADRHRRLLARLLELLAERGMVRATPVGWQVIATDSSVEVDTARLRIAFPDAQTEIALVERCASALPAVLRDDVDALTLLFPGGGFDETRHLYADTPPARVVNALVAAAVSAKASGSLPDRRLRVLEVGAGTGATTAAVLDALPAGVVDYVFTDVSPAFVAAARDTIGSRFAERANMRFGVLDIESDPTSTPLEGDQFDVIVAANVLHATADVAASLANIRRRLVPGGLLVLAEATRPNASVDLTFGLTDGWWRFTDTSCRASHPLLSGAGWEAVLAGSGFGDVAAVRGAGGSDVCGQLVLLATAGTQMSEEWIVVGDTAGLGAAVARRLSARSIPCTVIADRDAEALRQVLGRAPAPRRRVVHLVAASPGIGDVTNTALHATVALLDVTQAVIAGNGECELWAVTRGAQAVGADAGTLPAHAPVWGLGRVIAVEHPDRWGGLIDLAPHAEAASAESEAAAIVDTILGARVEDQFALRDGLVFVPRLVRLAHALGEPITCSPENAYLVTGGLGGLGLKVAHWLAVRGAGTIVLTGRSALAERASWHTLEPGSRAERQVTAIRAIEALGATVVVVAADVADPDAMTSLVGRFGRDLPLLRGVVHCAATLGNASVTSMTAADVDDMFRPKISGTWLLHELTAAMPLDFFVLFSSTTALWGSRDLGHYAAANQFLDAVAHHRRALGLTALSVDWGTWDEMRVASAQDQVAVAGAGLLQMPSDDALAVLGGLLGEAGAIAANVAVASVDWDVLKPVYEARRRRPFLAAVGPARIVERRARRARHEVKPELALRLAGAEPGARLELIVDFVRDEVARALGIADPRLVDPDQGLFEMGMDSLMSVELKSRLEVALGTHLPSTLTFNYPNISALAGYLVAETIEASHEGAGVAQPAGRAGDSTNTPPANATDDLSEVDLAALLATRLANLQ